MKNTRILYLFVGLTFLVINVNAEVNPDLEVLNRLGLIESRLDGFERKLAAVDALLNSFEELCRFLSTNRGDREVDDGGDMIAVGGKSNLNRKGIPDKIRYDDVDVVKEDNFNKVKGITRKSQKLKLVSIHSDGMVNNAINVSAVFIAADDYVAEWFMLYNDTSYRSTGLVSKRFLSNNSLQFTSRITLHDLDRINWLSMFVDSKSNRAAVTFNITALKVAGSQIFNAVENEILQYQPEVIVPKDIDSDLFNITVTVSESMVENLYQSKYRPEFTMNLVNSTATPPTAFTIWGELYNQQNLTIGVKEDSINELVIRLHKRFAILGGILELRLPQDYDGYLSGYTYGVQIRVINEQIGDLMPIGTLIIPSPDVRYVKGPYISIECSAFGNPLPKLTMLKKRKDGKFVELKADYEIADELFITKVLVFNPMKNSSPEGNYICQASTAYSTTEREMTYLSFQMVEIDSDKSFLAKNTTEKTVITCKAKGNPTPKLELRKNNQWGENLLENAADGYKHKFNTRKRTNKVTLVISPPDDTINSVHCVAIQRLKQNNAVFRKMKEIEIRTLDEGLKDYNSYNLTIVPFYDYN